MKKRRLVSHGQEDISINQEPFYGMVKQNVHKRSQDKLQLAAEMNQPIGVESKLYRDQTKDMKVITNKSHLDVHTIRRNQVLGQVPIGFRGELSKKASTGQLFETQD